jgi:YesN/AraC family two-component response regulator
MIIRYKNLLKDKHSNIEKAHISWLMALVIGFLVVMTSETVLLGSKIVNLFEHYQTIVFMTLGLTGNYMSFVLVNLLVFTAIRHFWIFEKVIDEEPVKKPLDEQFVNPEMAAEVDTSIRNNKTYMDPDITLDTLAESLAIMPRDLSMLINRHFGINFYEFVNRYRIEEAKRMLVSEEFKKTTITDIYLAVGFNSKSVFYTFFKKFEGVTPSQFRQTAA